MAWESDPTPGENGTKLVRRRGEAFVADGTERRFGGIEEIEVTELERRLDGDGEGLFLLDVRGPYEWGIANLGEPLLATLLAIPILAEHPGAGLLAGGPLVIAGLFVGLTWATSVPPSSP